MADYTRNPDDVKPSAKARYLKATPPPISVASIDDGGITTVGVATLIAGEDIEAGQPIRRDPTDSNVLLLSDADGTADEAKCDGLAANTAAEGQPVAACDDDPEWEHGLASADIGDIPVVSSTKGELVESASRGPGMITTTTGIVYSSTHMQLTIVRSGVAIP